MLRSLSSLQERIRQRCQDLVQAGVIDPTKVTRSALQNASSIASLMLTTEAMVCEAAEDDLAAPSPSSQYGNGFGHPG